MEIELKNINFGYKKVNYYEKKIFDNLSLCLDANINCIIGPNGSGKTTLLDIINNDLKIQSGEIIMPKKAKIGYVKEQPDFVADTVREELTYAMMDHNYKISEKRIKDVLLMVGLSEDIIDTKITKLTTSQTKLLSLASALIYNPNILLLDNFTEELDDITKKNVIKLIKILKNRYDKMIIIASNDLEFVHIVADKVFVIYQNKLVCKGSKYDVFKEEKTLKKYGISVPNIIKFENLVLNKKDIKLGYRDEINDLIKDIYRYMY